MRGCGSPWHYARCTKVHWRVLYGGWGMGARLSNRLIALILPGTSHVRPVPGSNILTTASSSVWRHHAPALYTSHIHARCTGSTGACRCRMRRQQPQTPPANNTGHKHRPAKNKKDGRFKHSELHACSELHGTGWRRASSSTGSTRGAACTCTTSQATAIICPRLGQPTPAAAVRWGKCAARAGAGRLQAPPPLPRCPYAAAAALPLCRGSRCRRRLSACSARA